MQKCNSMPRFSVSSLSLPGSLDGKDGPGPGAVELSGVRRAGMKHLGRLAVLTTTVILALAGCGGAGTTVPPGAMTSPTHQILSKSWMLPEAKGDDLLYATAAYGSSDVYVYSYPEGKFVGNLDLYASGYSCVDGNGNIFFPGPYGTYEYAHGGSQPINYLSLYAAFACSIDPVTGNLAVTTLGNAVYIYADAQGTPTEYTDTSIGGRADFRGNTQSGVVRYSHYLMQLSLAQVRSFDNR